VLFSLDLYPKNQSLYKDVIHQKYQHIVDLLILKNDI
jgi:hypothetical protein